MALSLVSCKDLFSDLARTFRTMDELFPASVVERPEQTAELSREPRNLDSLTYTHKGKTYTLEKLFKRTDTTGFLVVADDKIVYEKYLDKGNEDSRFTSWSMAKSFVSALVGIALHDGLIVWAKNARRGHGAENHVVAGGDDARPQHWPPGPRRATSEPGPPKKGM